jgi:hypothetical protein
MSGPTTWTGTAEVTWSSGTGVAEPPLTFSKYSITFGPGILYGTGKATVSGDGIKDGDETDIDALGVPTGFSCSTPAVDLTSATIETVLEMRKSG